MHEWADAELLERVEVLEEQVTSLEADRNRLEAEPSPAGSAGARLSPDVTGAAATADDFASPSHAFGTAREAELAPIVWDRIPLFLAILILPWVVVGSLADLVWQLAS